MFTIILHNKKLGVEARVHDTFQLERLKRHGYEDGPLPEESVPEEKPKEEKPSKFSRFGKPRG